MPKKSLWVLLTASILILLAIAFFHENSGCSSIITHGKRLPAARPKDLQIISGYSTGGMTANPFQYTLSLSERESYYQNWQHGVETRRDFVTTPAEMDALYQMIRTARFDRFTRHLKEIYDSGSSSVNLAWDETTIYQGDDGTGFVDDKWRPAYDQIQSALNRFAGTKVEDRK
jgi:hypothetical protein